MVNHNLIAAKLSELALRIGRIRQHRKSASEALARDTDALELVSFNLMLAVQVCADIASHLIADENWPAPRNLTESFARLSEHNVVSAATASVMGKAVGLRNVVAHGYTQINAEMVFQASQTGLARIFHGRGTGSTRAT